MATSSIIVTGTVTADGNLAVDQRIPMPAGRVQITIEPMPESKLGQKDWWQQLMDARSVLEERGTGFRSQEEIEAEREAFRAEN